MSDHRPPPDCEENGNVEPPPESSDSGSGSSTISSEYSSTIQSSLSSQDKREFSIEAIQPIHEQKSQISENSLSTTPSASPTSSDGDNAPNIVDSILGCLQSVVRSFMGASDATFLSNYDIDKLSVSQDSLEDFATMVMCETGQDSIPETTISKWKALVEDEDHPQWERRCRELMSPEVLNSEVMRGIETHRGKLRAFFARWGAQKRHSSRNIFPVEDLLTARKVPVANTTDAVRGRLGFKSGVHAWDIRFTGPLGTHCSVGVSTADSPLYSKAGYLSLIGNDKSSWGWDIIFGNISHDGKIIAQYPETVTYTYTVK